MDVRVSDYKLITNMINNLRMNNLLEAPPSVHLCIWSVKMFKHSHVESLLYERVYTFVTAGSESTGRVFKPKPEQGVEGKTEVEIFRNLHF